MGGRNVLDEKSAWKNPRRELGSQQRLPLFKREKRVAKDAEGIREIATHVRKVLGEEQSIQFNPQTALTGNEGGHSSRSFKGLTRSTTCHICSLTFQA